MQVTGPGLSVLADRLDTGEGPGSPARREVVGRLHQCSTDAAVVPVSSDRVRLRGVVTPASDGSDIRTPNVIAMQLGLHRKQGGVKPPVHAS